MDTFSVFAMLASLKIDPVDIERLKKPVLDQIQVMNIISGKKNIFQKWPALSCLYNPTKFQFQKKAKAQVLKTFKFKNRTILGVITHVVELLPRMNTA